ncbi:MAG: beta-galactosidase, partial [Ignavibacteriae bacterium]|nr:beta-galactosidase [Ignavibacteriota bacterium]
FRKFIICNLFMTFIVLGQSSNRDIISLNKNWKFVQANNELDFIKLTEHSWINVEIPHTWNNKDIQSGNNVNYGTGWYKRDLIINNAVPNKEYFLKFDGVGQYAKIYINDKYLGEHLGGYSAFIFNITKFIHESDTVNSILVRVNNELNDSYPKDNFLFGIYGGIYRDVNLIVTNKIHIGLTDNASNGVYVTQENIREDNALLKINVLLKNETSEKKEIVVVNKLISSEGKVVSEVSNNEKIFPGGLVPKSYSMEVKNPRLWNGKIDPYLYTLVTELYFKNKIVDVNKEVIGLRYFEIDPNTGFILNGKPYRLKGVCRHQEWKNFGNALLPEHHKKDMELINEVGATSIRLAHYQQADYIYSLADSIGFLIWAEIPFVNGYKENADENAIQQLTELIKQNYNSPSIFVWGVHNEVIKGNTIQQPVNLTNKLHNLAKTLDPTRYTVSVSNIWWVFDHPIHELTDLQGFNQYTGWYGGRPEELEKWINNYHNKKPDVRVSISEYGAGGNIEHQTNDLSITPDPKGQFFPETYNTYYHEVTYSAIEKYPFIWSSYIWNMFDFSVPEWDRGGIKGRNHKGLITYDRKTKKDAFYWYKANWSDEPVFHIAGKRNDSLSNDLTNIKVYSNIGTPELIVNGKSFGLMKNGINSVQYIFNDLRLENEKNDIEIKLKTSEKIYTDKYILKIKK